MNEKLTPEHAVRLLRAKASEYEALYANVDPAEADWLAADLALIASLLADHIEYTYEAGRQAGMVEVIDRAKKMIEDEGKEAYE